MPMQRALRANIRRRSQSRIRSSNSSSSSGGIRPVIRWKLRGSGGTSKPNSNASVPGGNLNPPKTTNVSGSDVVNYAMQFVGKPYVWGGKDPNTGADCSGFTSYVYAHFGISIPSFSGAQRSCGQEVSYANAQAGDLICYAEVTWQSTWAVARSSMPREQPMESSETITQLIRPLLR